METIGDVVRYGICKQNVIVSLMQKDANLDANTLLVGTLVRIIQEVDHKYIAIQVWDYENRAPIWKNTVWFCPLEYVIPLDSQIWEYIPPIASPLDRVRLVQDIDLCEYFKLLKPGLYINFTYDRQQMKGLIKYIGPVNKGQGFYIGVQLLGEFKKYGNTNGTSGKQTYFKCSDQSGLFITAADIILNDNFIEHKLNKNFDEFDFPNNLLSNEKNTDRHLIDNLVESTKKLKIDSHLRLLNGVKNGKADDAIKLLSDWPQKILSDCPSEQIKSTNTMNRRNSSDTKSNTRTASMDTKTKDVASKSSTGSGGGAAHSSYNSEILYQHPSNTGTNEVDLIEIIQGEWPAEAGDTIAPALNTTATNVAARISEFERNKSINPISHIIHPTKKKVHRRVTTSSVPSIHSTLSSSGQQDLINLKSNQFLSRKRLNTDPPPAKLNQNNQESNNVSTQPIYDTPERSHSPTNNSNILQNDDKYSNNNYLDNYGLGIGSLVEVNTDVSDPIYGVIRWISPYSPRIVGVELEEEQSHLPIELTDGTYNGQRYFKCTPGKGLFVPAQQCHVDQRFQDDDNPGHHIHNDLGMKQNNDGTLVKDQSNVVMDPTMFGQIDCPVIEGSVPPLCMQSELQVEEMCGKFRGIQGHHNSCYLDATLFAMFACTGVFDSLLFRPQSHLDIERYEEVQKVLREEIVNPLRQNLYVRADRVMKLRTLLEQLSSVTGLTSEEKDPEEFLNSLLAQILRAEPFLKLSSGQEAFYYQLFVEKNERLTLPSVQQLFEQSFLASNIKLKEVPSCLIIQMPRFGKSYKMYPRIIPSQVLDVTDIIEDSPRQCTVCGKLAEYECLQCFDPCGEGLEGTAYCQSCRERKHGDSTGRSGHKPTPLRVPADFRIMAEHCPSPPRLYMELFAVVCIETSHYVAFVKCGSGHDAPWCFFDSMADRKGEQNGYNIPEIVACPGLASWLGEDAGSLPPRAPQLPEPARRLLCDAYLCLYQSSDIMMYR
ncbi:ubiquitin carboxyl-terminal hydrolase CYLD [Chrysoperla carnea]|uniref:ubiquitin carboxyl-terminal hydrolase CYLD n=1 Tax=Chrysoperla carnea TaxID=189513 RepID=UPI001D07B559|nr:ubiquitin carboxyl-terminal hydrolase CYLD [Chrysoperla carnea]